MAPRCRPHAAKRGPGQSSKPSAARGGFLSRPGQSETLGLALALGRIGLGATFLAGPVTAVRLLGLDTATAKRAAALARMLAARDIALGAGATAGLVRRRGAAAWVLAGAGSDAADAAILLAGLRSGRIRGTAAIGLSGLAAAGAIAGVVAVVGSRGGAAPTAS